MNINERKNATQNLLKILEDLSQSQNVLSNKCEMAAMYDRLEKVYYTDTIGAIPYRHEYSEIFGKLVSITDNGDNLLVLSGNVKLLCTNCVQYKHGNLSSSLLKLFDHISLDVGRIAYIDKIISQFKDEEAQLKGELCALRNQVKKATIDSEAARAKIENAQKESISILGIFSAIVIAFASGALLGATCAQLALTWQHGIPLARLPNRFNTQFFFSGFDGAFRNVLFLCLL